MTTNRSTEETRIGKLSISITGPSERRNSHRVNPLLLSLTFPIVFLASQFSFKWLTGEDERRSWNPSTFKTTSCCQISDCHVRSIELQFSHNWRTKHPIMSPRIPHGSLVVPQPCRQVSDRVLTSPQQRSSLPRRLPIVAGAIAR